MNKTEVVCPNCGTSFKISKGGAPISELSEGIHVLVPETVRNNNVTKANVRMEALKSAGVNVDKLQNLMSSNDILKTIFDDDDPILEMISKGGFIKNPELFRRWITAQTFALIKDANVSWTDQVRKRYDTRYVFKQTRNELYLQIKLIRKGVKDDKRFQFFTLEDMKAIFIELAPKAMWAQYAESMISMIKGCTTYSQLDRAINFRTWHFRNKCKFMPQRWLNCFKGAGAYYTLQNIIRTHGFVLPSCNDMQSSLDTVEHMFNEIVSYSPSDRRWDMLMSLLMTSVSQTHFELKW